MSYGGLELLLQIVKQDLHRKEDVIVCTTHWKLISKGFICTGVGSSNQEPTVHLPDGWSRQTDGYLLRYTFGDVPFILKVQSVEDVLLISLMRKSDGKVTSTSISASTYVGNDFKSSVNPLLKAEELYNKIQTELIDPFSSEGENVVVTPHPTHNPPPEPREPRARTNEPDPLMIGGPRYPQSVPLIDPFNIGHSDLHPFSNVGPAGGMLFPGPGHPNRPEAGIPGNLPRGSIPPGARFDPIGPPNPNMPPLPGFLPPGPPGRGRGGFAGPDPDHLPPPPGYDDMFM